MLSVLWHGGEKNIFVIKLKATGARPTRLARLLDPGEAATCTTSTWTPSGFAFMKQRSAADCLAAVRAHRSPDSSAPLQVSSQAQSQTCFIITPPLSITEVSKQRAVSVQRKTFSSLHAHNHDEWGLFGTLIEPWECFYLHIFSLSASFIR